jgi:16S rRNA (cytosine1407-C5)-methyltransferase
VIEALPAGFIARLRAILPPAQIDGCLASFAMPQDVAFRVNTLKTDIESVVDLLTGEGLRLAPLPWYHLGFRVGHGQRAYLTASPPACDGRIYIQNPASMLPAMLLGARPGEMVLDLAAAPGGKTLQLAAQMQNRGTLSAVEAVRGRFFRLKANLERGGVTCTRVYLMDGAAVWRKTGERFDRVLLDAPCSSEARFRADDPSTFRFWSLKKVKAMQRKQLTLLDSAIRSLKPGGELVYSTCSFAPEENEAVVSRLLARFTDALAVEPIAVPMALVQSGLTEWQGERFHADLSKAVRILPDVVMEGFFVCKLRKLRTLETR